MLKEAIKKVVRLAKAQRAALAGAPVFDCPICGWHGVLLTFLGRPNARCPRCTALERHRIQQLILDALLPSLPTKDMRALHFAPEPFFQKLFARTFQRYETADIDRDDVDHRADLQALPFGDGTYDFVFASHVLEHVRDDHAALREIRRVLRPGGVAILPVPIFGNSAHTVEYAEPDPNESMHVRAPGRDYYDRYREVFSRVDVFDSSQFPERYQVYQFCPIGGAQFARGRDFVPVCYVQPPRNALSPESFGQHESYRR